MYQTKELISINNDKTSDLLIDASQKFIELYNYVNYQNLSDLNQNQKYFQNFIIVMISSLFVGSFFSNLTNALFYFLFISYIIAFLSGAYIETKSSLNSFFKIKKHYFLYKSIKKLKEKDLATLNHFVEDFIINQENMIRDKTIDYYNSTEKDYKKNKTNVLLNELNKINQNIKHKKINLSVNEKSFWIIKKLVEKK